MECHHEAAIKPRRINCCAAANTKTLLSELHPDAIAMSSANATMKVTSAFGLRERNSLIKLSADGSCGILFIPCRPINCLDQPVRMVKVVTAGLSALISLQRMSLSMRICYAREYQQRMHS